MSTLRIAIYARYSSDLQSEKSIEDQVRECVAYLERQNPDFVYEIFSDRAMSGASRFRPSYQELLKLVAQGKFDVVMAEALDRLSRDQEDLAYLFKHLQFHAVRLQTLSEGEIGELHVGLKGTMNALFLKDLAIKTRRGLEGRILAGRSAGGLSYGYEPVRELDHAGQKVTGLLRINEAEAEIIKRIFAEFADGKSPRQIARELNAESIPGPRGTTWTDTAIRGHKKRGTGIINNERYIGKFVWNRQRFIKDPQTGKRVARLNPPSEWVQQDNAELRIISDNLWKSTKARQEILEKQSTLICPKNKLTGNRRTKFLLSGLLTCGECNSKYIIIGKDRYGCATHKNRGTCSNNKTILRQDIERRVLSAVSSKLLDTAFINVFIDNYLTELTKLEEGNKAQRQAAKKKLLDTEKRLDAVLRAIEQGIITETTKTRLIQLEREKAALESEIVDEIILPRPNPGLLSMYKDKVKDLGTAIYDPAVRDAAMDALRPLMNKIVLYQQGMGGLRAELHGDIAGLVSIQERQGKADGQLTDLSVRLSLVAGAGFEPAAFRL